MKIEKYVCDLCKKEVNQKDLKRMKIPCQSLDCEGRKSYESVHEFELCPECVEKLRKAVYQHFARVDMYGDCVHSIFWPKGRED